METTNGGTVTFAPGTLDRDVVVVLSVFDSTDVPAPPAGAVILGLATILDAEGESFAPAAQITFSYDPSVVVDPATLGIWAYTDGAWTCLGGTVDSAARTISVNIVKGAMYAMMSRPLAQPPQSAAEGLPDAGGGPANGGGLGLVALAIMAGLSGAIVLASWRTRRATP